MASVSENTPYAVQGHGKASADDPFGVKLAAERGIALGEVGHELLVDNDYFRVWDITLRPHQTLDFHMHYRPSLIVAMGHDDAEVESIFGDKRFGTDTPGRLLFFDKPGPVHKLTNVSEGLNVTKLVEVKSVEWDAVGQRSTKTFAPTGEKIDTGVKLARERGITLGEVGHSLLMDNEFIRVWEVLLEPGETIPYHHHHHPYLVISVEGDDNLIETIFGDRIPTNEPTGHVVFIGGLRSVHQLTNISKVTYRSRLIELKAVTFESDRRPEA